MATIYNDQHRALKDLIASAGKGQDATLLIPDLQRPYVWQPSQVVVLVDSLIRGWPFGTLLTWKVKADDPARNLARSFWSVVDRTGEDEGDPMSMKHPPASFQMVLDGQQRLQSLLIAFGGDSWGFKLLDRQWHEQLSGTKPRGPRGKAHWSLGCLCIDVPALSAEYSKLKRASSIDYTAILKWVITDRALGQSKLAKPATYIEALPSAERIPGQYVRLARLWEAAPDAAIDNYEAEDIGARIMGEHDWKKADVDSHRRALGALIVSLREVKQTRVTYLELSEYEEAHGAREIYNDAIVNIFTRLNTAGRTLTREDITFAWLKIGWNTKATGNKSAKACFDDLAEQLDSLSLPLSVEDVISAISFVWAASFNAGKLLSNNDLMRGEAIRPMAAHVSENWDIVVEAATRISTYARDRGLRFRDHFQSVNALAYLFAWQFIALQWARARNLKEVQKDALDKRVAEILDSRFDRWLICSQWAGVWASSSSTSTARYAAGLSECAVNVSKQTNLDAAMGALTAQIDADIKDIEQAAITSLSALNADDRQQVRSYYTALWIWNRLDQARWTSAQLALREKSRRKSTIEVDHIVAYDLWQKKVMSTVDKALTADDTTRQELLSGVNDLGNCMLLEKNFNISKSNASLKAFLEQVHEFKSKKCSLEEWAKSLELDMQQVDSTTTPIDLLRQLFTSRAQKIRADLEQFVRGTKMRVDIDPT